MRYVSDGGEVSFTIRAGTTPTRDAWTIGFSVLSGVLEVNGDNDHSGGVDLDEPHIDLLADPVERRQMLGAAWRGLAGTPQGDRVAEALRFTRGPGRATPGRPGATPGATPGSTPAGIAFPL